MMNSHEPQERLDPPLLRTLEPEVMDDPTEAILYDEMDHSEVNQRFVDDFFRSPLAVGDPDRLLIDLGCGTAQIPIQFCRSHPEVRIMAIDAAPRMLELAIRNIDIAGLRGRIELVQADAKSMPEFSAGIADAVISNSLLHHLAHPFAALQQARRLVRPGGRLFFRDLMRPTTASEVDRLTELYAGEESPAAQQLLHQSLHAALTLSEIREMIEKLGFDSVAVQATSDRHWTLDVRCV